MSKVIPSYFCSSCCKRKPTTTPLRCCLQVPNSLEFDCPYCGFINMIDPNDVVDDNIRYESEYGGELPKLVEAFNNLPLSDSTDHSTEPSNLHTFESGAVRSTDADGTAYTLLSPIGLRRIAQTAKEGEKKYTPYNWEKGMPVRDMLEHALRHIYKYLEGDRSEDHLAHAGWNLLGAMHSEEKWPNINHGTLRGPGCEPPTC